MLQTKSFVHLLQQDAQRNSLNLKNIFTTLVVVAVLDRVNIVNRKATIVVELIAQALGYDISGMTLFRISIQLSRKQVREATNNEDKSLLSVEESILFCRDGKLQPVMDEAQR